MTIILIAILAVAAVFIIKYIIRLIRNPDGWYEEHKEWDD